MSPASMNTLPWLHPERVAKLEAALAERILVIDGAMGTMIQRHDLQEADYRGERFAEGYDVRAFNGAAADQVHAQVASRRQRRSACWLA